jgi:NMD protein affecting ribosome stability and mRNA decay
MKTVPPNKPAFQATPRRELLDDPIHDPYQDKMKLTEPTVCDECGAVWHAGRWQWTPPPADSLYTHCPACRRIHDKQPAGYVTIAGEFAVAHRKEVESLIRNLEEREKAEHPMQRIMEYVDRDDGIDITTTDVHLARGIGEALHRAFRGKLDSQFGHEEHLVRVHWSR